MPRLLKKKLTRRDTYDTVAPFKTSLIFFKTKNEPKTKTTASYTHHTRTANKRGSCRHPPRSSPLKMKLGRHNETSLVSFFLNFKVPPGGGGKSPRNKPFILFPSFLAFFFFSLSPARVRVGEPPRRVCAQSVWPSAHKRTRLSPCNAPLNHPERLRGTTREWNQ